MTTPPSVTPESELPPAADLTAEPGSESSDSRSGDVTSESEHAPDITASTGEQTSAAPDTTSPNLAQADQPNVPPAPVDESPSEAATNQADQVTSTDEATPADEVTADGVASTPSTPSPPMPSTPTPAGVKGPTPGRITPAAVQTPGKATPVAPTAAAVAARAATFGSVDPSGAVFLRLPDGSEHQVGEWATGDPEQALSFFANKYADLVSEIDLSAKRLADGKTSPAAAQQTVERVNAAIKEPAFIGDMAALVSRVGQLEVLINVKKASLQEAKAAARQKAHTARVALVEEAEVLAKSQSWKVSTERFKTIVDEWKAIPRNDRDRATDNELWKRLSAARTNFDKHRRAHYAELDSKRDEAKAAKEKLVKRAQEMSTSRDWASTTRGYKDLLEEWKKAGRAGKSDDALWAKFRAAQDGFFASRNEIYSARSEDETKALATKEALLVEAEKLVPVTDAKAAKRALRDISDRWEKAGKVPRNDIKRIEARLKKVEDTVRDTDAQKWQATNPELAGRASDTVIRFRETVEKLERQLQRAKDASDEKAASAAENSLVGARAMLAAAESSQARIR